MPPVPSQKTAGQYYLLEKIAQGGMAEIYKGLAYDLAGIKKIVCIKKILPHIAASREFIDMLVDEAKIAVKLSQGNIAQIYDLGKAGEDYFIVMEFVDGQTLSKIHKKAIRLAEPIPIPIACHIIAEIAGGLNYIHRKTDESGKPLNIIHRDISPQNIMVSYSGTVKIIDFGIAKAAVKIGQTESGILKGKFAYMSPEQARGDTLDQTSDIFSLGVIFHELLTNHRLFKGASTKETLKNVKRAKVPPPSEINPEIPEELDDIVLTALNRTPRERYSCASDFQEALFKFFHTHYPDFKSSHVAEYLHNFFKEEKALQQQFSEEELKTPHLLLEKTYTQGMIADDGAEMTEGRGSSVDWDKFMLEKELGELEEKKQEAEKQEVEIVEKEEDEKTDRKWFSEISFKKQIMWMGLSLLAISVSATYFAWTHWWKPQSQSLAAGTVVTEPAPPPPPLKSEIQVESNPPGAKIYLDDADLGLTTPAKIKDLVPGQTHTLGLFLQNHKFYKTWFEGKPGEIRFFVGLTLDYGSIKVASLPDNADVYIDGIFVGKTTLVKEGLNPGSKLTILIKSDGFEPYIQEIQIAPGKENPVNAQLTPQPH